MPEWWDPWPGPHEIAEYWQNFSGDRSQNEFHGSLNHPVFGAVLEGIVNYAWGLRQAPGSRGYRQTIIEPLFIDKLKEVKGKFTTAFGVYVLEWKQTPHGVCFEIEIPQGCSATLMPIKSGMEPMVLNSGKNGVTI